MRKLSDKPLFVECPPLPGGDRPLIVGLESSSRGPIASFREKGRRMTYRVPLEFIFWRAVRTQRGGRRDA